MKKLAGYMLAWAVANLVAISTINWYEQRTLEHESNLRRGILSDFGEREIEISTGGTTALLKYRLYVPHITGPDVKYPVVLYLHGAGERGFDNASQLRSVPSWLTEPRYAASYPCFVLVPQCPDAMNWEGFRTLGRSSGRDSTDLIIQMLESVLRDPAADRSRVYLVGYSMGSIGAWQLAAEHPDYFAAAIPISGGVSLEQSKRLNKVSIWALHGDVDPVCPVKYTRDIVATLSNQGSRVRYTELVGVGHDAQFALLANDAKILAWMFEQNRKGSFEEN